MPKIDFSKVEDVQDFSPLEDGKYLCGLSEVEESTTQYGDELWKLKFEVIEGDHTGRFIFDNLVFSSAAMKRAKLICSRLGLDVSSELDLKPSMLEGRKCYISVVTEEYEDSEGKTKKRNVVSFAGYERAYGAGGPDSDDKNSGTDGMPF